MIEATYSGRFTFIHFPSENEYEAAKALQQANDLQSLWTAEGKENPLNRILAHEYTHKHIFAHSRCGLILNGWRFFARARFLAMGDTAEVIKYYKARTIFYTDTYQYHEEIAEHLDTFLKSGEVVSQSEFTTLIPDSLFQKINSTDDSILFLWKELGINPKFHSFYEKVGKWLHGNFALMLSYRNNLGEFVDTGFADQGITNDVGVYREDNTIREKWGKTLLLQSIVMPLYRLESFEKYFLWFWVSQRTQFQTLQETKGISLDNYLAEYGLPVCEFILTWAGTPSELHVSIYELVEDALVLDTVKFQDKWGQFITEHKDNSRFERFFTFFYLHGN